MKIALKKIQPTLTFEKKLTILYDYWVNILRNLMGTS